MIIKRDRNKLKKILGGEYAQEVLELLNNAEVVNRLGNPHNTQYISKVFNGVKNNDDVEDAIYKLAEQRKAKAQQRKSILN